MNCKRKLQGGHKNQKCHDQEGFVIISYLFWTIKHEDFRWFTCSGRSHVLEGFEFWGKQEDHKLKTHNNRAHQKFMKRLQGLYILLSIHFIDQEFYTLLAHLHMRKNTQINGSAPKYTLQSLSPKGKSLRIERLSEPIKSIWNKQRETLVSDDWSNPYISLVNFRAVMESG